MLRPEDESILADVPSLLVANNNIEIRRPPNAINEFEISEIEQKFQVLGNQEPKFLDDVVGSLLEIKNFTMVKGLERFRWIFHFDYYGFEDNGKTYQAFHSIHHESTPKYWIRKKLPEIHNSDVNLIFPLVRGEEKQEIVSPYSEKYIVPLVEQYGKLMGREIFFIGRLTRRKYYSFLKNERSQRAYNIGLDFCEFMGKQMSQLEIEYKWRNKEATEGYADLPHLLTELDQIGSLLLSSPVGITLERTTLTKFEWMLDIKKEN